MANSIIVGVLDKEQSDLLARLTETAPIKLITSPILILSSPDDYVSEETAKYLEKSNLVTVKPYNYSYVYNPATSKTECLIACAASKNTPDISTFMTDSLGMSSADKAEFIPYFLFAYDPMQSRASRHFFPGILHVLNRLDLKFELLTASEDHYVYKTYNSEAQNALIQNAYLSKQEL